MSSWFQQSYDEDYSFSLYSLYESGDNSVLNSLMTSICPLIRRSFKLEFRSMGHPDQSILEAEALHEVYRVISDKGIPTEHKKVFTRYLVTVIIRCFRDELSNIDYQCFDYWKVSRRPPAGSLPSYDDVEMNVYHHQLSTQIRSSIQSRIRFSGVEGEACRYLLDCQLGYKKAHTRTVRDRFRIKRSRYAYFLQYINILIKSALWEFGERERKNGPLSSYWATSRDVLCSLG